MIISAFKMHGKEIDLLYNQKTTYKVHMDIFKNTLTNSAIKKINVNK